MYQISKITQVLMRIQGNIHSMVLWIIKTTQESIAEYFGIENAYIPPSIMSFLFINS